ncbi:cupin domain-containing protein [Ferrovibrio sp.]|uniref:cupin domain-containing protein n=1 Tax=Ferrovibrio sp. TaxID=1917215 RepID=UPI001B76E2F5|nr:cupin domain-containing protein [Ferrovibrio sp.]MBP7065432.1 cupin domain-containing protein [Ferrovibrio sp.]
MSDTHQTEADRIIQALGLLPHPEGGHFAETFRDPASHAGRSHGTAIYFLLKRGERSHWHRVDAAETWHVYAGAPLRLGIAAPAGEPPGQPGGKPVWHLLGGDILAGQRPQAVVPAGHWQAAESTGAYTLVGCTVAPGFDFAGFELAPPGWEP